MQPNILEGVVTGDGSFKSYTIFYLYYLLMNVYWLS